MSYYVNPRTGEIRCETTSEALAMARAIATKPSNGKAGVRIDPAADGERLRQKRKPYDQSLAFLASIKESENGIGGDKLVKAVKCDGPSGLGTVVANTRRFLKDAGVGFDTTTHKKRSGKLKLWVAGATIDAAVAAIKDKMMELFPYKTQTAQAARGCLGGGH